jgi:hypothetical protein
MLGRYPYLIKHEEVHKLAVLLLPWVALLHPVRDLHGLVSVAHRRPGARNFFERQAGLAAGGYIDYPVRPIGEGLRAVVGKLKLTRS